MQKFKKDLFFREYGKNLEYQSISGNDLSTINSFIESELGGIFDSVTFFKSIIPKFKNNQTFESLDSENDIKNALEELNISNEKSVFVIWNYPDQIDSFDLNYLISNWQNIWFGVSDDVIGLFLPETSKMILITHWNTIYY